MFIASAMPALVQLPQPLLTVYLNTNPALAKNCRSIPGYQVWLKSEAKSFLERVPAAERLLCQTQIERVERALQTMRPEKRGIVFFSGANTWQQVPLAVEPKEEMHWGKPMLWQLCCITNDFRPALVAVLELSGARLFLYQQGTLVKLESRDFEVDTTQWKLRQRAHMARLGTRVPHSSQADIFERRIESRYRHLLEELTGTIIRYCGSYALKQVYLLGSERLTTYAEKHLAAKFAGDVSRISHVCSNEPAARTQACVEERLREVVRLHEEQLVEEMLQRGSDVVTGVETLLSELQRGRLSSVLVTEEFDPVVYSCPTCSQITLASAAVCEKCGVQPRASTLHEVLPELMVKYDCRLEIVREHAANRLSMAGGIGGRVRMSQHKTPVNSLRHSLVVGRPA